MVTSDIIIGVTFVDVGVGIPLKKKACPEYNLFSTHCPHIFICVCSIIERFPSNFAQTYMSTRQYAEIMLPLCKVKVILGGQISYTLEDIGGCMNDQHLVITSCFILCFELCFYNVTLCK